MAGFVDPSTMQNQTQFGGNPFPPAGAPPPASLPTTTVDLTLRCANLKDKDVLSKSDPVAVVFEKIKGTQNWREVGRTERISNDLNPKWTTKFTLDYRFEENQPMKFEVYDWDTNDKEAKGNLEDQDFLGRLECTMAAIVSAPQKQYAAVLRSKSNKGAGTCFIVCEEVSSSKEVATLHFAAKDLDKKDFLGKSDPFMVISRSASSQVTNQSVPVFKTNIVKNTLKPSWDSFNIPLRDLCNGDYERPLRFEVFDWDSDGSHDLIGEFTTTFTKLKVGMVEKTEFKVVHPKKAVSKKNYKDSGKVFLKYLEVKTELSFLDYIQGGTALNFSVAVDFTASNGDPTHSQSLHFRSGDGINQYTQAIRAVGEIIEEYDADKQFPALGFGAKVPPHYECSHEFFLNLSPDNPYCAGVGGIMQAYYTAVQSVQLYGPTNFRPVIDHVAKFANAYQDGRQYFVLLIITDGIITDFEETKAAIVGASALPMSIIIIGVGQEDFSAMEELDADKGLLRAQGRVAARDIVQFVEMRKFSSGQNNWDKAALAKEVLAEVPKQLVGWMNMRGLKPVKS